MAQIITRLASNTLFSKGGGNSVNVDTLEKTTQSTRAKGWAEGSDKRLEAEDGMHEIPSQNKHVVVSNLISRKQNKICIWCSDKQKHGAPFNLRAAIMSMPSCYTSQVALTKSIQCNFKIMIGNVIEKRDLFRIFAT